MSKNEQTLKEVLMQLVSTPQLRDKYLLVSIRDAWKSCFGPTIQQYTTDLKFRDGVLTVLISSAPLRYELSMSKDKIIRIMNETLKEDHVKVVHIY